MSTMHELSSGPEGLGTYEYRTRPADQLPDRAAVVRSVRLVTAAGAAAPFRPGARAHADSATIRRRRAPTGQGAPS